MEKSLILVHICTTIKMQEDSDGKVKKGLQLAETEGEIIREYEKHWWTCYMSDQSKNGKAEFAGKCWAAQNEQELRNIAIYIGKITNSSNLNY